MWIQIAEFWVNLDRVDGIEIVGETMYVYYIGRKDPFSLYCDETIIKEFTGTMEKISEKGKPITSEILFG